MFGVRDSGDDTHMGSLTLHGANPENLFRALNAKVPRKILDFSTNTNILSWPSINIDIEALASRYPDPECTHLRELIAEREHITPSRILFTNGTNEAIFLLSQLFTEGTAILQPSYTEYSRAFRNLHGVFRLEEAGRFRQFIIVNPNNPTGIFLHDLAKTIADNPNTTFIIDEAYRDFLLWAEPERLCDFRNAIILRSLTKIFHLSGARIGYVIAPEELITSLKARQPSWSVNAIAQELAHQFLTDETFTQRTRDLYRRLTPAFIDGLRNAGLYVRDSDVHFFLVKVDDDLMVIKRLLDRGIAVRHTRNFSGLKNYIRVATKNLADNKIFIEAMTYNILP